MGHGPGPWTSPGFWAGALAPVEACTGLDPRAYTDAGYHEVEQVRVFERAWVGVGLAAELEPEGRVLVRPVGGRSVLVTRDGDGALRGFLNACRHRGTELCAEDCTVGATIRCPYHRWGYALDGRLVAAPRLDEVPRSGTGLGDLGLVPVRVESWAGLLFACLDARTPPLERWLGDLPERMAGYDLERWRIREHGRFAVEANWKLISENYQEYYHLAWVHPGLSSVSRVADHYRYQGPGMYLGQTTTPVSGDERQDWLILPPADGLDASDAVSGRFVALFPNVLLSVLPNHVFVIRLVPDGPGRTTEECTWLLPPVAAPPDREPAPDDEAFAATRDFWIDVNREDVDIVERAQRGLDRGGVPPGPLALRFEEPLHRFHTMVAAHLTTEDPARIPIPPGDGPEAAERFGTGPNPSPPAIEGTATHGGDR